MIFYISHGKGYQGKIFLTHMIDRDNILTYKKHLQTNRKWSKNKYRLFTWKEKALKQIFLCSSNFIFNGQHGSENYNYKPFKFCGFFLLSLAKIKILVINTIEMECWRTIGLENSL